MNHQAEYERLNKYDCQQLTRMLFAEFFNLKQGNTYWMSFSAHTPFSIMHCNPARSLDDLLKVTSTLLPKSWSLLFTVTHHEKGPRVGVHCPSEDDFILFKSSHNPTDMARDMVRALIVFKGWFDHA